MTFFVGIQIDLRERFIYAPVNIAREGKLENITVT